MAYNPTDHISQSKPFGTSDKPLDGKFMYYDKVNFKYRPFISTAEVLAYFPTLFRRGNFDILVNTGGTLSNGVVTGGTNDVYWFRNGTTDGDLVLKSSGGSIGGLQEVTTGTGNNKTSNAIQISGVNNLDIGAQSLALLSSAGNSSILNLDGGSPTGSLSFEPSLVLLSLSSGSQLELREQTGGTSGASITSRLAIQDAININEAVTLGQVNALIPGSLTFTNGLRNQSSTVKLGLDIATLGTTNEGILTEDTYFLLGDTASGDYTAAFITNFSVTLQKRTSTYSLATTSGVSGDGSPITSFQIQNIATSDSSDLGIAYNTGAGTRNGKLMLSSQLTDLFGFSLLYDENFPENSLIQVYDERNDFGMKYNSSYSAKGKLDPLWIPDWGSVQQLYSIEFINVPADADYTIVENGRNKYLHLPLNSNSTNRTIIFPPAANTPGRKITVYQAFPYTTNNHWIPSSPDDVVRDEHGVNFAYFRALQSSAPSSPEDTQARLFIFQSDGILWRCLNKQAYQDAP